MKNSLFISLFFMACFLFQGCVRVPKIHNISHRNIESTLIIGKTTKIEVYQALGLPWGIYKNKKGIQVVYRYQDKEKQINDAKKQLALVFNSDGILKNFYFSVVKNESDRFIGIDKQKTNKV